MGSVQSESSGYEDTYFPSERDNYSNSKTPSFTNMLSSRQDGLNKEISDLENEFTKSYRSLTRKAISYEEMPCKNIAKEIVTCMKDNPEDMKCCLGIMTKYQECVNEVSDNKLADYVGVRPKKGKQKKRGKCVDDDDDEDDNESNS